jgi:hypothetical protein
MISPDRRGSSQRLLPEWHFPGATLILGPVVEIRQFASWQIAYRGCAPTSVLALTSRGFALQ